jgi:hypothetical protein
LWRNILGTEEKGKSSRRYMVTQQHKNGLPGERRQVEEEKETSNRKMEKQNKCFGLDLKCPPKAPVKGLLPQLMVTGA